MKIDVFYNNAQGLPYVLVFESARKAINYAKRAVRKNSETVRKIRWIGRDSSMHYTPVSDWYDAISVLQTL